MKNQVSRDSFHPARHYSGVYLQQGRMILDADWNELTDIEKARLADALRDAISGTNTTGGAIAGGAPRVGGLKLYADPNNSVNIRLQPGVLYVEGVPAFLADARRDPTKPLTPDNQADYPLKADYTGQSLKLYADVWERNVTALEQSTLLDAALHGADTATRSQTMLQVKWCANTLDPLNEQTNPPVGTAPLSLRLRLIASGGDPCDPCASQVKVDERLGNYLFRVEVHDYDAASHMLTLKWSRDNGAEACAVDAMPQGFNQGDWVWEYFDSDTERLLGNHFATNPKKLRGLLKATCTTPTGADEPKSLVRQWDGAMKLNLNTGTLVADGTCPNLDRGVALFPGTLTNKAAGRFNLNPTTGVLQINLELMELEVATTGSRFVAGDYWLAEVREAAQVSGQYVLPPMPDLSVPSQGEPPRGVRHHYLFLGEIGINKKLVAQDDAFRRRMAFPPLSDIVAADVGFSDHCVGLFAGAKNVQQALDNLCTIGAEDIAYSLPNCGANEGKSVKDRLKAQLDPDNDGTLTVKTALDNLLCQLNADSLPYVVPPCTASLPNVGHSLGLVANATNVNVGQVLQKLLCDFKANHLPLDKNDATLCSDLKVPAVVTVQDALKILCGKMGGGCAVVATSPEHLGVLLEEFAKSNTATDLWVCLKGGSYTVGALSTIAGKRSLRLSGEGSESVSIIFNGTKMSVDADEVILENLSCTFSIGTSQLAITANSAQARGCRFSRTSSHAGGPAMINIGGRGTSACRLEWRDNVLYAQVKTATGDGAKWAGADVTGSAAFSDALLALGNEAVLDDKAAYDAARDIVAKQLIVLPKDTRTAWKAKLDQLAAPAEGTVVMRAYSPHVPTASAAPMSEVLASENISYAEAVSAVDDMVAQWVSYSPAYALRLTNRKVGGVMAGNVVDGWLLLANGVNSYTSPAVGSMNGVKLGELEVILRGGEDLQLLSNTFTAIKANLPSGALDSKKELIVRVPGHEMVTMIGNRIGSAGNCVTAANLIVQGNYWDSTEQDLGYVVGDHATFTGNLAGDGSATMRLKATVITNQFAASGNLRLSVQAMR